MDEKLSLPDIDLIFGKCVIFYKNKPIFIEQILPNYEVSVRDLLTQKRFNIKFNLKDFSNPVRRIGFININKSVVYCYRTPVRKFKAGLCDNNIRINLMDVEYPFGREQTRAKIKSLYFQELGEALVNSYPTFREAIELINLGYCAVAFDKQFAIDNRTNVWYKTQIVGNSYGNKIIFHPEMSYLRPLLGKNYETV